MRTGNQPAVLWPAELKSGEVSEAVSPGRRAGEGRQGRENYREVRRVSVTISALVAGPQQWCGGASTPCELSSNSGKSAGKMQPPAQIWAT